MTVCLPAKPVCAACICICFFARDHFHDSCTPKLVSHACMTQVGQHRVQQLMCKQDHHRVHTNNHTSC